MTNKKNYEEELMTDRDKKKTLDYYVVLIHICFCTSGVHVEEEAEEEEVEASLRGRLLSLVERIKTFKKKKEDEEPEPEEEPKPSE